METTNLPQLQKEWMVEDAHKAKKMIACMVYKYVRDVMFNETTATHVIVDSSTLNKQQPTDSCMERNIRVEARHWNK